MAKQATSAAKSPKSGTPQKSNTPARSSTPIFVEQEWQKPSRSNIQHDADLEWAAAEGDSDAEEWECVACNKSFRSEAAWDSHERSRKHMQAVERLRQQMLEEDDTLELGEEDDEVEEETFHEAQSEVGDEGEDERATGPKPVEAGDEEPTVREGSRKKTRGKQNTPATPRVVSVSPTRRKTKGRRRRQSPSLVDGLGDSTTVDEESTTTKAVEGSAPGMTKKEKRRAKEAAKKAQASEVEAARLVCLHSVDKQHIGLNSILRSVMCALSNSKARRNCSHTSMTLGMH